MHPMNAILQNQAKYTQKDFGRDLRTTGMVVTQDSKQITYDESSTQIGEYF